LLAEEVQYLLGEGFALDGKKFGCGQGADRMIEIERFHNFNVIWCLSRSGTKKGQLPMATVLPDFQSELSPGASNLSSRFLSDDWCKDGDLFRICKRKRDGISTLRTGVGAKKIKAAKRPP